MAWNNNNDEVKISEFNSAGFKMRRLDKIMTALNELDDNLLAWNGNSGDYNYKIKFSKCENLYQEVESKLTDSERTKIESIRKALQYFIDNNPIWRTKKNMTYPYKEKKEVDEYAFKIIRRFLSEYESECRRLVDTHGMDTSYGEEEGLF